MILTISLKNLVIRGDEMIAIKTKMKKLPKNCDDCQWLGLIHATDEGWSQLCELMNHCMDDDQPKEWIYDGNGRPEACPLIEI